jgi:hypothetical protein
MLCRHCFAVKWRGSDLDDIHLPAGEWSYTPFFMAVDAAHEWGYQRYSDFEQLSDNDKAVAMAYTKTVKLMRAVEMEEQARKAKQANKPKGKR